MTTALSIKNLSKTYKGGVTALKSVDLDIERGEILALLGPNGAGKTTMISIICGLVRPSTGTVTVEGNDIVSQYREARKLIGLVPQELHTETFETVWATVSYSRGLFGKKPNPPLVEQILRDLSLYEKKDSQIIALSGGMKRRVMIAKALAHEPRILFLDEPTAGVDVELRKDMWRLVKRLRDTGVTIILTTHYIEEAEEIADRVGVIRKGELLLVEDKAELMRKLGQKQLTLDLQKPLESLPETLSHFDLKLTGDGQQIIYSYDTQANRTGIATLLSALGEADIIVKDLDTQQRSLEDIFVSLVVEEKQ
ncbi:ABC transporter ATP-binding protein [Nitratireductor sp. GZWM139]|uniref:ABC transporter ATP-binding protein n=1 Tax=Nitratireductor sp. GZWM139 TaxID=2950541 RepID=UPI0024BE4537|nr:ABC transporter ATP-binding protein [Nitratireductor sp. GZWM139]MDJ1462237.1 ABC transporter ATP-binding protein [Nitratireductor sp. GZWM139]